MSKSFASFVLLLLFAYVTCTANIVRGDGGAHHAEPSDDSSVESLVNEALNYSPDLRALTHAVDAAEGEILVARKWENPDLTLAPAIKRIPASPESPGKEFFTGTLELGQLIEYPGKRALRQEISEKDLHVAKLTERSFRFELQTKVEKLIFDLVIANELNALRKEQLRASEAFLQATRQRAQGGYASDFDAVRAQAEAIAAKKVQIDAETTVRAHTIELNCVLGRDSSYATRPAIGIAQLPIDLPLPQEVDQSISRNPSVEARKVAVEKADLTLQAAMLSRRPDITTGPSVEYAEDERIYGLTVSLPIPVWDGKRGEIQKASAELAKARSELRAIHCEVRAAAQTALEKLKSAHAEVALFSPAFTKELKSSMERAEKSYATTGTTALLYLDAKRTYFDTIGNYYSSLSDFIDARAELSLAVGSAVGSQKQHD